MGIFSSLDEIPYLLECLSQYLYTSYFLEIVLEWLINDNGRSEPNNKFMTQAL